MNLSGTFNQHCRGVRPSAELSSGGCAMRCRGVARAFDRGLLGFLGKANHSPFGSFSGGTTRRHTAAVGAPRGGVFYLMWFTSRLARRDE